MYENQIKCHSFFPIIWFVCHPSYESIYLTIYSEVMVACGNISIFFCVAIHFSSSCYLICVLVNVDCRFTSSSDIQYLILRKGHLEVKVDIAADLQLQRAAATSPNRL